jgi:hypothetical protein
MPKEITSPIKRWAGTVTIADPLTLPQAKAIEAALDDANIPKEGKLWLSVIDENKLPAVIACVQEWHLDNFTPDPFPASPRGDSHKLIDWIFGELIKVYAGEAEIPNESSPTPIVTPTPDAIPTN